MFSPEKCWHRCRRQHPAQFGLRASHTARPCRTMQWQKSDECSGGRIFRSSISILTGSFKLSTSPSRFEMRMQCVSTTVEPGTLNTSPRIRFAVFLPTPEPNKLLNSGSFSSNTGVPMNIRVDWSISSVSGSQAEVTVKVSLDSYSLHLVEVPGAVTVDLNGSTATMASPAVDYDGKSALNTPFGSKTFTVNISSGESISLPLSVTWHFGGKYSNVDLTDIIASGTVSASR